MIYLRDLNDNIRAEYERDIRKNRPDLAAVLDANESPDAEYETDIIVGDDRNSDKYEVA